MKTHNVFLNIPHHLDQELFQSLLKHDTIMIERIISKGHSSPKSDWYNQEKNEWVMVLKGKAILSFEDQSPITLNEGDFINIPAHKKHRVAWTDPDTETIWLAVHY